MTLELAAEYGAEALAKCIAMMRESYEPWRDERQRRDFIRRLRRMYRAERALIRFVEGVTR